MKHSITPEERKHRQAKYANLLIILAIMIAISTVSFFRSENAVNFDWTENQVQITDPSGAVFTVVYEDVTALELLDQPDYGTCVTGKETSSWIYGTWENSVWGTYRLCASTGSALSIVIYTAEERYVISYESDTITSALYDSIQRLTGLYNALFVCA